MNGGVMELLKIILGLILLVFGRKLFWLFVGIAGFLVGMEFTHVILADQHQWVLLLVALGAGLLGALLAVFLERIAFALSGFYAGSYLALMLAQSFGADRISTLLFIVGGVVGAILAVLIMDWALIMLSSLVGAGAIVGALGLGQPVTSIVFIALVISGALLQARLMNRTASVTRETRRSS